MSCWPRRGHDCRCNTTAAQARADRRDRQPRAADDLVRRAEGSSTDFVIDRVASGEDDVAEATGALVACQKNHRYLRCTGRQKQGKAFCDLPNIPAKPYEQLVIDALRREVMEGHELAQSLTDLLVQRRMAAQPELRRRGALEVERDDLKRRIEEVLDLTLDGGLQKGAASERLAGRQRRVIEVEAQLAGLDGIASALASGQMNTDVVMACLRGAMGRLDAAPPEQQRCILLGLVEEVRIDRGREVVLTGACRRA